MGDDGGAPVVIKRLLLDDGAVLQGVFRRHVSDGETVQPAEQMRRLEGNSCKNSLDLRGK